MKNMEIEGDSMVVVQVLKSGKMVNWKLQSLLDEASRLVKGLKAFLVKHIYKEANGVAN